MHIGVNEICYRLIFCLNVLISVYFKGTLKDIIIFAIVIIIFYNVSSFQSADFGEVTRKIPESKALLKIKISVHTQFQADLPLFFVFLEFS